MFFKHAARSIWNNPGNRGERPARILRALEWQIHKRLAATPRIIHLANGVLFKAYPDCVVSSAVIYADFPEYYELTFLRHQLNPGDLILDVGAYVGHISLLLADIVGPDRIYAYEPSPLHFQRLVENWHLNRWPTDTLFCNAVGDRHGQIYVEDLAHPSSKHKIQSSRQSGYSVQVPMLLLDDLCNSLYPPIGLLKIDVEGYECQVFLGGRMLLKQNRPKLIMFESLTGYLDSEIAAILVASDYRVFQLDSRGRPDFANDAAQNLFAVASEYQGAL